MKPAFAIFVLVLPAAFIFAQTSAPTTRDASANPVAKAMAELFAQDDPAAAKAQRQAVLKAVGEDMGRLKAAIAADVAYEKLAPGWMRKTLPVVQDADKYEVEYFIRVPGGYDPAKSWPLLLVCHGQHGNGRDFGLWAEQYLGKVADDFIIVAPTMPGDDHCNGRLYQELADLRPLEYARLHINVDDDRIFITGYSQGGHQSWHLATMYTRLWAAAVPVAGVPWFEGGQVSGTTYMENLAHLPLWAIWGEKDVANSPKALGNVDLCRLATAKLKQLKNANYIGTELPGMGHQGCQPKAGDFLKFIAGKKRVTPTEFTHCFHLAHHARGYWLEAVGLAFKPVDFSKPIQLTITERSEDLAQETLRQFIAKKMFRITGKIDAATNTVTVRGVNVRSARLYVIDGMLDLSRPVTINYFGKMWKGRIAPSPECALYNYTATRDQTQLIVNEIDLFAAGKVTPKYK